MSPDRIVRYRINSDDELLEVDEGWRHFALANDAAHLLHDNVLGRVLWDFLSDDTTRQLYQQIVKKVRKGASTTFTLRCDGPTCRRHLGMTIRADESGNVEFETTVLRSEDRETVALLDPGAKRSDAMLRVCAWCNRIDTGAGQWMEVEDAIRHLRLFELAAMPQLTHGVCGECFRFMESKLDQLDSRS
ncbi:MAG: hypothetical protein ABR538_13310 [Candidatus Binatia bacterium]